MESKKYIIIKELPDGSIGTEVIWDGAKNCYYYQKSTWVSPHQFNYLSAGQVTQTPEYFIPEQEYIEYRAFHESLFSRKEVMELLENVFEGNSCSGQLKGKAFQISISSEKYKFQQLLRETAKNKIKTT